MNTVAVLMSTYNGEKYLKEQIDSILKQKDVAVSLYIRDDGSRDHTVSIIQQCQKSDPRITLFRGENVDVGNSFMNLLYQMDKGFDYYAFADQDDVWLPDKMSRAVEFIKDKAGPALYASNQMLVDRDLNVLGLRYSEAPDISYRQILCQNKISGCTMVWNKALNNLLTEEKRRPGEDLLKNRIHDVWVAMVAGVTGVIVYDPDAYILYRQHENNVVGVKKTNRLKQWAGKIRDPGTRNGRSSLCREIYLKDADLITDSEVKETLYRYGFYKDSLKLKLQLMRDAGITAHTDETKLEFRLKVLAGLL